MNTTLFQLLFEEFEAPPGKIVLSTNRSNHGAYVSDDVADGLPVVPLEVSDLYGFEDDDKMELPHSAENVESMKASIDSGKELPPIFVRKMGDRFQVLDGHHRFKVAKDLRQETIRGIIIPDDRIIETDDVNSLSVPD